MKGLLFLIIFLVFQTVFSQNEPVTVLKQKWYERVNMRLSNGNDPFSAANSGIDMGANNSTPRQTINNVSTNKSFVYETVIRNNSDKNIIGLAWDYVFFDSQGKVEKARKNFVYLQKIKKNKKETLFGNTSNPANIILDAKDYENPEAKPKEIAEIRCVVFEDKTSWKRSEVDEKVCMDLLKQIYKRKKR